PFLVFGFRDGIPDDAAAGPREEPPFAPDQRADRDVQVHVAVEADVTDTPAIDAAALRLERLDDLHRANLRRAGDRAAGECRAHEVERVTVGAQPADDRAHEMMHVREAFDIEQLLDGHAARLANL